MKFLPWDRYDIQTSSDREQIVKLLESEVEPKKWLRLSRRHKTFEGKVSWEGFKITRIIHYRNSFLPIIQGAFEQSNGGIVVKVRMHLHPFVIAFMCFWFGGLGIGICGVGVKILTGKAVSSPLVLIPFAMLLFGWLLVYSCFWFEARKARVLLDNIVPRKRA